MSLTTAQPLATAAPSPRIVAAHRLQYGFAASVALLHVATAALWGWDYFRDELYYLACGRHLAWGYVDHPPLIALVARLTTSVLGDSLVAIRLVPALASGVTVACAIGLCRRFGGGIAAQILTGTATALAPIYVAIFGIFSMNSLDIAIWAVALTLVARILDEGVDNGGRLWPAFGVVAGIGLMNKISVLFLGFGLVVGLVLAREWGHLRHRRFWLGGLVAGAIFAPNLIWQAAHGWPTIEFMVNATTFKNVAFAPRDFLAEQVTQLNPLTAPLWIAGLVFLLVLPAGRPWRALGWAYFAILLVMLTRNAKPYYLSPIYPLLLAAGAAWLGRLTARRTLAPIPWIAVALVGLSGLALAPMVKPLLPLERHIAYATALGQAPSTDERKEVGRLSQFFADRVGWEELALLVSEVYTALPPVDRAKACVFGQNYGQAAAIDRYAAEYPLPPAISGHNSYWSWGPGTCTGEVVIVIDDERADLERWFDNVEQAALYTCEDCMPYENNKPVWVCRGRFDAAEAWPALKHFD